VRKLAAAGLNTLPGNEAFFLYDTRGLPLEIIEDLAQETGLQVDEAGFSAALEAQRERARQNYEAGKVQEQVAETVFRGRTAFVGYDYSSPLPANVQAILVKGKPVDTIHPGQTGEIVLDQTPFYAEAGGQVGDTGIITLGNSSARVTDTIYRGTIITHLVEMQAGAIRVEDTVQAQVDLARRRLIMKNHTATHLLHAALRRILGSHVKQAGSLVSPERLRFDFSHFSPLSPAEIDRIEDDVNGEIWLNVPLNTTLMNLDDAMQTGAVALFGEKYQEQVRVVEIAGYSKELCGGTHVHATGAIGLFKIISESGIAAGIRRVEAITARAALDRFRSHERVLEAIHVQHKISRDNILSLLDKLHSSNRVLQQQIADLKLQNARANLMDQLAHSRLIAGIRVFAHVLPEIERSAMRSLADELKNRLGTGIVVLGAPQEDKVALIVMVSADLAKRLPAGRIAKELAPLVGGSGGGKAELAEAGGKDSAKLADAIERSYAIVQRLLRDNAKEVT